jgi:hypothetical protein
MFLLSAALLAACSVRAPVPSVTESTSRPPPSRDASALPRTTTLPPLCPPQLASVCHVCALLVGGWVSCWGKNDRGQLAGGVIDDSVTPRWSPASHGVLKDAVHLAAHGDRTCAVTAAGFVECWGNLRGQDFEGEPECRERGQ